VIKNGFLPLENTHQECMNIPVFIQILKNDEKSNVKAEYKMYWRDIANLPFKSGLRRLRSNIFYGDRWQEGEPKSFMIIRYQSTNTFELHYFDGDCPRNDERTAFLNWYLKEAGIAEDEFKTHPKSWEQKKSYRY
jgi:hypothetical protein